MTLSAPPAPPSLADELLGYKYKSIPAGLTIRLGELGHQGWNVARGDLQLPVTTLYRDALEHNIRTMAQYCRRHDALLAPHGKTSMAPQLFRRQLDAGAWGITAATPAQVRVMRAFRVPRILLANEVVETHFLRWVAGEIERDDTFDFFCLVDAVDTVRQMDKTLDGVLDQRRMRVLLEVGATGGRTGTRDDETAMEVARAVAASRHLTLVGVEGYEGLLVQGVSADDLAQVDGLLVRMRRLVITLFDARLFDVGTVLVSAGGSIYFDRVTAALGDWSGTGVPGRLLLRSGCYVSHDSDRYRRMSPLDGRAAPHEELCLQDAIEAWAVVLSRPEPGLAILGAGKRDLPYDVRLPTPKRAHRRDGSVADLTESSVTRLMDQHAFVQVKENLLLSPGDIVAFGLSHPCAAFDKAPLVPIIDERYDVVDGVLTFF